MYGGLVKLVAQPGRKPGVIEFLRWDADVARRDEPGTLRFDVWEVENERDAVYLYEAYVDRAAFDVHERSVPKVRCRDRPNLDRTAALRDAVHREHGVDR